MYDSSFVQLNLDVCGATVICIHDGE